MIVKRDCIYTPKGTDRPLHIYLPEGYDSGGDRYPVMYFFDGHNLFTDEDATYGKSWGMKGFLDGWSKPMIVVGIECGHEGQERLSEYLPYPATGWFGQFDPAGEATMDWIIQEVKPMIDQTWPTIPFRECTGIGGSSMGGLMALYAGARYNRWFSKAACVSTAMGFCMPPLMADLKREISADTRVYLSWGTRESLGPDAPLEEDRSSHAYHNHQRVRQALERWGAAVELECQVGGGHCEADWEKLLPGFMEYLWMR